MLLHLMRVALHPELGAQAASSAGRDGSSSTPQQQQQQQPVAQDALSAMDQGEGAPNTQSAQASAQADEFYSQPHSVCHALWQKASCPCGFLPALPRHQLAATNVCMQPGLGQLSAFYFEREDDFPEVRAFVKETDQL